MRNRRLITILAIYIALGVPLFFVQPVFAQAAGVGQVESFIKNIIKVIAGLAGLVATGFFVIGGFGYITSSGNPENLDRSKRTLLYSSVGLAITIGAFVLSNIVTELATNAFGD
jgi:multisubunit Na+/H+ antiporter MnhC subunit